MQFAVQQYRYLHALDKRTRHRQQNQAIRNDLNPIPIVIFLHYQPEATTFSEGGVSRSTFTGIIH